MHKLHVFSSTVTWLGTLISRLRAGTQSAQFAAESRRRSNVDEYLETQAAVVRLSADGLEQHHSVGEVDVELGVGRAGGRPVGDVHDDVVDGLRQRQTDAHQADAEAHPDKLFDPTGAARGRTA